jgi:hypothetical protein
MSTQFELIIEGFVKGSSTLEATCQQLAQESQADPSRTRFWGQRVETEMRRGRIAGAARSMLDASKDSNRTKRCGSIHRWA